MNVTTEQCARAICIAEGVDPDATGYALTDKTRERFGASYPLWKYRLIQVEAVLGAMGYLDKH